MLIRAEQMAVFEDAAAKNFEQRLAAQMRENHDASIARLPDSESAVKDLPEDALLSLIKNSIERARDYELTSESAIAAFTALRFEVSPNFDKHRLSQVLLKDKTIEPNARLDELLAVLSEKNWETIRAEYDVNAWQSKAETETAEENEKSEEAKKVEFADTMPNVENADKLQKPDVAPMPGFDLTLSSHETENSKSSSPVKRVDLDSTLMNFDETIKTEKISGDDDDFDMLATIPNYVPDRK